MNWLSPPSALRCCCSDYWALQWAARCLCRGGVWGWRREASRCLLSFHQLLSTEIVHILSRQHTDNPARKAFAASGFAFVFSPLAVSEENGFAALKLDQTASSSQTLGSTTHTEAVLMQPCIFSACMSVWNRFFCSSSLMIQVRKKQKKKEKKEKKQLWALAEMGSPEVWCHINSNVWIKSSAKSFSKTTKWQLETEQKHTFTFFKQTCTIRWPPLEGPRSSLFLNKVSFFFISK